MRAKRWVTTAMIGVTATFGLAACGGGGGNESRPLLTRGIFANSKESVPRFNPEEVRAPLNQEISFNFENTDNREHNFTLTMVFIDPDHFVNVDVPAKQSKNIRFTIKDRPRDGFLSFYCRFHQQEGMQGKIYIS